MSLLPRTRSLTDSFWRTLAGLVFLIPGAAPVYADDTINILFISSKTSAPYQQFVTQTTQALNSVIPSSVNATSLSVDQLLGENHALEAADYDMLVTLGSKAAQALDVWRPHAPVLYTLIPRASYDGLKNSGRLACPERQCTVIYIDQPLTRLLTVIDAGFTGQHRLGVLLGPTSRQQEDKLVALAEKTGISLETAQVNEDDDLLPALNDLLKQTDLLLSIPDPVIYNRRTAKSILLTTYRYKVPVIAYSRAYADAGAALSVYSTPRQMGIQAAGIIASYIENNRKRLPPPQYPRHYKIRVNSHVVDSLDLDFDNNTALQLLIKEADDE